MEPLLSIRRFSVSDHSSRRYITKISSYECFNLFLENNIFDCNFSLPDAMNFFRSLIALDSPIRVFYHYLRGLIAFHLYRNPARDMIVIGVTGTKGKTTVTNLIARGLEYAGKKVFMFSTANYSINGEWSENNMKMTSPSPFVLQHLLNKAKAAGCTHAVIETSSHSIFYNRNYGIDYDVAVLTNICQDHLDLHHTMENYARTKLQLFQNLVSYRRKP